MSRRKRRGAERPKAAERHPETREAPANDSAAAPSASGPAREPEGQRAGGPGEGHRIEGDIRRELEELEDLRDRHLRLAAEFENYRKRTRRELVQTRELAQADLAARLLDTLDDLARVASVPVDTTTVQALHEGVALVERNLRKVLSEVGMEGIDAEGQRFDPEIHEALMAVPTDDPDADETISRVLVEGYRFGDRLLRPARVEVRKFSGPAAGETSEPAAAEVAEPAAAEAPESGQPESGGADPLAGEAE
ncbi:MAG: nucleotide exchange factor GrpE [Gemmatimonadota bacterium]